MKRNKTYRIVIKHCEAATEVHIELTPVELRGMTKVALHLEGMRLMFGPNVFIYNEKGLRVA